MNMSALNPRLSFAKGRSITPFVVAMLNTWRQRHALDQLDDHILDDIGLTRHQVTQEHNRPIWDVPSHWTR